MHSPTPVQNSGRSEQDDILREVLEKTEFPG